MAAPKAEAPETRTVPVVPAVAARQVPRWLQGIEEFPDAPTHAFWIGTIEGSPRQDIPLGGIAFPRKTEQFLPTPGEPGEEQRVPVPGTIADLSQRSLEMIRRDAARKVVRWMNREKGTSFTLRTDPAPHEVPYVRNAERDEPIGNFVYCVAYDPAKTVRRYDDKGRALTPDPISKTGLPVIGP